MIDTMARKNDFAALRAIDMIARLRGLVPTTAKRSDCLEAALEEARRQPVKDEETEEAEETEQAEDPEPAPPAAPDIAFDPPMPPEIPPPVKPAPELPLPAKTPDPATEAARAAARRRLFCYDHLIAHHPELSSKVRSLEDALGYFDDANNLLPQELWPPRRCHGDDDK
jgi:hypothetical protein